MKQDSFPIKLMHYSVEKIFEAWNEKKIEKLQDVEGAKIKCESKKNEDTSVGQK